MNATPPPAVDLKSLNTALDDVVRVSIDGDFAGALARLNRLVAAIPFSGGPRLYRGILLDVLGEEQRAVADYRAVFRERVVLTPWIPDQAALAIWTIRSRRGERAEADRELRQRFEGRKPDLKANFYVFIADFLLDRRGDEAALMAKTQHVEPPSLRLMFQADAYYFISVRRQLDGDKAGAGRCWKRPPPPRPSTPCGGTRANCGSGSPRARSPRRKSPRPARGAH